MASLARLHAHPLARRVTQISVEATVAREADRLMLQYRVLGNVSDLLIPTMTDSKRRDELWRSTCAEAFVTTQQAHDYCEFNFSPSSEWAAYQFDDYRQGMRAAVCDTPVVVVSSAASELRISVQCSLPGWLTKSPHLLLGLTMVVEDAKGQCSYWALHHPGEQPDFHHRDGFVVEL